MIFALGNAVMLVSAEYGRGYTFTRGEVGFVRGLVCRYRRHGDICDAPEKNLGMKQ
jgi:hypothetical protein